MPSARPQIQIGNEVREMNEQEIAQYELDQIEFAKIAKNDQDRAQLKQATLSKLGLTADEAAALLS